MEIVTGCKGQAHVTAAQAGAFNAGILGTGEYVLENGEELAASIITNNLIRIGDGDIVMQGRHITITKGTYEEVQIANGLSGMNRNDLIVIRYSKESTTGIENAKLVVIQGVSTEGIAQDPEYKQGNILDGDLIADMPLYRIKLTGLNVEEPERLFEKQKSLHSIANEFLNMVYPVGSIYLSVNAVNPSNLFGGTWTAWGAGKVPVGINTSDSNFNTVEKAGGTKTVNISHTHTMDHTHTMAHTHTLSAAYACIGFSGGNQGIRNAARGSFAATNSISGANSWGGDSSTGVNGSALMGNTDAATTSTTSKQSVSATGTSSLAAISVLQPYITCYMWKRIK